ncbi:MAG: hypothetical protein NC131_12055 [Roseburia sp.]|nr:hypothetical protein [Roseburia sp.]
MFIDSTDETFSKMQLMVDITLKRADEINVGDIICVETEETVNRRGDSILKIIAIVEVVHNEKHLLFKSRNNSSDETQASDIAFENLFNALNGGEKLKLWKYKFLFTEKIRELFISKGFIHIQSTPFMKERGTSTVEPFVVKSKFGNERYLNITFELELKKAYYITFSPVFEIGILSRDVYSTKYGVNEFLSLEFVAPIGMCELKEVCLEIIEIAKQLAKEQGISYANDFENITICTEEQEMESEGNTMYLNLLTTSPLAKKSKNGCRYEFKWKYGKKTVAHGYHDENNYSEINNYFNLQAEQLLSNGIAAETNKDYLDVLSVSAPPSMSFNFGIDRFLQYFLQCNSAYEINKILGV